MINPVLAKTSFDEEIRLKKKKENQQQRECNCCESQKTVFVF